MRRRFPAFAGVALVVLAVAATVAVSAPDKRVPPAHLLSPRAQDVETFQLAGNKRGDALATWVEFGPRGHTRLWMRHKQHHGRFGRPRLLTAAETSSASPAVAVGDETTEVVAWIELARRHRPTRVVAVGRSFYRRFSKPTVLARGVDPDAGLATGVGPGGTSLVVWTKARRNGPRQVQAAVRGAGGHWSHAHTISHGRWDASDPLIAFDGEGDATIAWEREHPSGRFDDNFEGPRDASQVAFAEWSLGGQFGRPRVVSGRGREAADAVLAENARGDAVIAWDSFRNGPHARVGYASRRAGHAFARPRWLTPRDGFAGFPHAYVDPDGRINVAWSEAGTSDGHLCDRCSLARIARGNPGGGLSHRRRLAGRGVFLEALAANSANHALAVWEREVGHYLFRNRVEGRVISRSGGLGRRRWLSNVGPHVDIQVLLPLSRGGIVAWIDDGRKGRIRFVHVPKE